jgi:hypothetical protein
MVRDVAFSAGSKRTVSPESRVGVLIPAGSAAISIHQEAQEDAQNS